MNINKIKVMSKSKAKELVVTPNVKINNLQWHSTNPIDQQMQCELDEYQDEFGWSDR